MKPGASPRYSVLIASRNEGGALRRTAESVLAAGPADTLEVVIVDDASTDGSADFAREPGWAERGVFVLRNDSAQGLIASRARAARAARGERFVFLDAHCAVEPGWLEELARSLSAIGDQGLAVPLIYELDEGAWTIDRKTVPGSASTIANPFLDFQWDEPVDIDGQACTCTIAGGAWMVSRAWYERLGGLDEDMGPWGGENLDFPLRTWTAGGYCLVVEEVAVGHLYRKDARPDVRAADVTHNKIRAAHTVFSPEVFHQIMLRLRCLPAFREALAKAHAHRESLALLKQRIESLRRRPERWLLDTFRLPVLETPAFHAGRRVIEGGKSARRRPLVSVIVPARGEDDLLAATVDSLLEKTAYGNWDLILVAGDADSALAAALRARSSRLQVVLASERLAGGLAENLGAAATAARYCAFLEPGTTVLDGQWIEKLIVDFETFERAFLIAPALVPGEAADGDGNRGQRLEAVWDWSAPSCLRVAPAPLAAADQPCQVVCPPPGTFFIHRQRFTELGGFDATVERGGPHLLDLALRGWLSDLEAIADPRIRFRRPTESLAVAAPRQGGRETDKWAQYARVLPFVKCFRSPERLRSLRGQNPLAETLLERHGDHLREERRRFLTRAAFDEGWLFYKFHIEDLPRERAESV